MVSHTPFFKKTVILKFHFYNMFIILYDLILLLSILFLPNGTEKNSSMDLGMVYGFHFSYPTKTKTETGLLLKRSSCGIKV